MTEIGVKGPKNIIPITIGRTTIPSKSPKRIHNLLRGKKMSAFLAEITKNNGANAKKRMSMKKLQRCRKKLRLMEK